MKNKLITAAGALLLVSCTQTFDITPSDTTFLPDIQLEGDNFLDLSCTQSFGSFGAKAFEGGSEIELKIETVGNYFGGTKVEGPDYYTIAYSALNKDGIPGSAFREVVKRPCTGDLVSDISGLYSSTVLRNGSTGPAYTDMKNIYIRKVGDTYELSDAIGGYYDFGRGYGTHYASTGLVLTGSGTTYTSAQTIGVGDFGGELTLKSFKVDPATKTIKFSTVWSFGYTFDVTLKQL